MNSFFEKTPTNQMEWTEKAREFDKLISAALHPIFEQASRGQYNLMELNYMISCAALDLTVAYNTNTQ